MERLGTLTRSISAQPKGYSFTQYFMVRLKAGGSVAEVLRLQDQLQKVAPQVAMVLKEAVAAGGTQGGAWGGQLVEQAQHMAAEFIEVLRPATVLGRMTGTRRVPFNISVPRQTAGALAGWIGEGLAKPIGELAFDGVTLEHAKVGGIVVFSGELMRFSDPACVGLVQADLTAAISQFSDQQLLDPNSAGTPGISPASITFGAPSFASTGSGAAQVEADFKLLVASLNGAGILFRNPYFVMLPRTALHLATLRIDGDRVFPNVSIAGGNIWGVPVLTSANMPVDPSTGDASYVVLVDAAEIMLAEGGIEIDTSKNASLQMRTDPQTGAQQLVNLWQSGLVGARVERLIRWQLRRPGAVATLTGVTY